MEQTLLLAAEERARGWPWILDRRWDLTWLVGSAAIVPLVLLLVWAGASGDLINLGVTLLVGGPHIFATYTATYLDPRFRRHHVPLLVAATLVVPSLVIYGTLVDFQILLSFFIFVASIHVLQQNAFVMEVYRRKTGMPEPAWSRWIDYGLVGISFYPIASVKLVEGTFQLGDIRILIPPLLAHPLTYVAVWTFFGVVLALWLGKTGMEIRTGTLNRPKTFLLLVTVTVAFFVPMAASGERMELAFQAVNAWHCVQYLGLVWLAQKIRKDRGEIASPFVRSISGSGRPTAAYYGVCFLAALVMLGAVAGAARWDPLGLDFTRYYYMGILSCLLIHYVLDGYLFAVGAGPAARAAVSPYASLG